MSTPAASAQADYRVQAGDVLEIAVASMPEMRQRVAVQLDGSVSLPLAGTIVVEGATVAELRSRVRSALASKIIRIRAPDGRDVTRTVEPDEVAVGVVEYKPVFVTGDIGHAGEQAFRPRMTARHAIIAAGGPSVVRANGREADAPALRVEYVSAWFAAAAEEAKIWRIRTELGEKVKFDLSSLPPAPTQAVVPELLALEREIADRHNTSTDRERDYFKVGIREADQQIAVLTEQQKAEEEGLKADTLDLQRAIDSYGKGSLPSPRVAEYRRGVLMSSTRKLQTGAQLIAVRRTRAEFARNLDRLDEERRVRLISERREALIRSAVERTRIQSAEEKLSAAGLQPPRANEHGDKLQIAILRMTDQGRNRLYVDQDTELHPGDVVEVSMAPSNLETVKLNQPAPGAGVSGSP